MEKQDEFISESPETVYKGAWEVAELCAVCGEYLSNCVTDTHWNTPCPRCGQIGAYCPKTIKTARRFVCIKKRLFRRDIGYYEWSGFSEGGCDLSGHIAMSGRRIATSVTTIAAAGIASGLF